MALPTGGTKYTDGSYTIHKFLLGDSGTSFTVDRSAYIQVLVVAGGGGGGEYAGGGGGAGGVVYNSSFAVTAQSYTVTVGDGGAGGSGTSSTAVGTNGQDSVFGTITAKGGGGGGSDTTSLDGGSGGGGGGTNHAGGSTLFSQGNNGGASVVTGQGPGGGGGAGAVGANGTSSHGGNGGAGTSTYSDMLIVVGEGQDVGGVHYIAGGGGGSALSNPVGSGGNGGGGTGAIYATTSAVAGTSNTGGGGGGTWYDATAGKGGSGIVLIRYLTSDFQPQIKKINGVYMGSQEIASTRFAADADIEAYWKGDDVNDSSGNSRTLTNVNTVAFNAGKFGNAFDTGASNSTKKLTVASNLNIAGGNCSINLWFNSYATTFAGDHPSLVSCFDDVSVGVAYGLGINGTGLFAYRLKSGIAWQETSATAISSSTWYMATMTYDGTYCKLYINGSYVSQVSASGNGSPYTYGNQTALFSHAGYTADAFTSAKIDDVFVASRALTSDEIYSLYKTGVKKLNGVDNLSLLIDSYPESNANRGTAVYNGQAGSGQSFACDVTGYTLKSSKFWIRKGGSPTGNVVSKIYAVSGTYGTDNIPTGSALATSSNVDISTLTTSYQLIEFTFPTPYTLTNGTKYFISVEYSGGDGSNFLDESFDDSSPSHGGNRAYLTGTTWTAVSAQDDIFYVYGYGTQIKKYMGVSNV